LGTSKSGAPTKNPSVNREITPLLPWESALRFLAVPGGDTVGQKMDGGRGPKKELTLMGLEIKQLIG